MAPTSEKLLRKFKGEYRGAEDIDNNGHHRKMESENDLDDLGIHQKVNE